MALSREPETIRRDLERRGVAPAPTVVPGRTAYVGKRPDIIGRDATAGNDMRRLAVALASWDRPLREHMDLIYTIQTQEGRAARQQGLSEDDLTTDIQRKGYKEEKLRGDAMDFKVHMDAFYNNSGLVNEEDPAKVSKALQDEQTRWMKERGLINEEGEPQGDDDDKLLLAPWFGTPATLIKNGLESRQVAEQRAVTEDRLLTTVFANIGKYLDEATNPDNPNSVNTLTTAGKQAYGQSLQTSINYAIENLAQKGVAMPTITRHIVRHLTGSGMSSDEMRSWANCSFKYGKETVKIGDIAGVQAAIDSRERQELAEAVAAENRAWTRMQRQEFLNNKNAKISGFQRGLENPNLNVSQAISQGVISPEYGLAFQEGLRAAQAATNLVYVDTPENRILNAKMQSLAAIGYFDSETFNEAVREHGANLDTKSLTAMQENLNGFTQNEVMDKYGDQINDFRERIARGEFETLNDMNQAVEREFDKEFPPLQRKGFINMFNSIVEANNKKIEADRLDKASALTISAYNGNVSLEDVEKNPDLTNAEKVNVYNTVQKSQTKYVNDLNTIKKQMTTNITNFLADNYMKDNYATPQEAKARVAAQASAYVDKFINNMNKQAEQKAGKFITTSELKKAAMDNEIQIRNQIAEQNHQKFHSDVVSESQLAGTRVLRDDTGWFSKSRNEQYTQIVSTARQFVPGITDAEIEALGTRNDNVSVAELLTLCFTKNPSLKTDPIGIIRILSGNDPVEMAKIKDEQSALNWIKRFGKEKK